MHCSKSYKAAFTNSGLSKFFSGVCAFLSIFMVSIVVYVSELLWFLIYAFHGLEQERPWAVGFGHIQ